MNVWLFILLMGILLIAIILILFWHPQRSQTRESTLTDQQGTNFIFRDDERYWYGGVFYNNPDDPALFVPKRYGLGWTMNFGHPQSKIVMIGIVLLAILPPVIVAIVGTLYPGSIHPTGCHPSGCNLFPWYSDYAALQVKPFFIPFITISPSLLYPLIVYLW